MLKTYFLLIIKKRKVFFPIIFISTILGGILAFNLPKWYLAEASFLAPELATNNLLSMSGGLSSVLQNFAGQDQANGYSYMAILNSRTINEKVAEKYDLVSVYDISDSLMSKTLKKLSQNATFSIGDNNETIISVFDKDPKRAASMANYYLELLNTRGKELANKELNTFKALIEKRVNLNNREIEELEIRIKQFQETEEIPVIITSEVSGLEVIGTIYVKRMELQIQKDYILDNFGPEHPLLHPLERQLERLEQRVARIPAQTLDYMGIYREYLIKQKIAEFILPLYEQVKLSAIQNIPDVVILDKAATPDRKKKPKRLIILVAAFVLSTICAFYYILITDRYPKALSEFGHQMKTAWRS